MRRILPVLALTVAAPIAAQDAPPPPLQVTGDVGFVNAAGNSEVTTLNVGEKLVFTRARLKLTQQFSTVYGRTGDSTTTSQWRASARGDYNFAGPVAAFGRVGFERNALAGITRRFEEAVGLAATVLARERTTLDAELGISLNQQTSTADVTTNFAAGRAAANFRQYVTEAAFLSQDVEVLPNLETTDDIRLNSESALTAPISSRIAVKLSYAVKFDNVPEPGFEKTDRIFTAGLQIVF